MSDLAFRSTSALAAAIRAREVSACELLDCYVDRIARSNERVNAVVTLDVERAREEASEADAALARGESRGPLHGVPFTIKDSFETAGLRTTCGWEPLQAHVPEDDAIAVARLRDAGAIVFGKTNVLTLAADVQTYNPIFGVTRNPWDLARTSGGSSGGAAAALAAGLTGGEFGSDIGGSIRTPSNWCGVFGHKPSWGIVPQRGHIPGPPGTRAEADLNVVGPLGRSADDLDLLLEAVVAPLPEQAVAWSLELPEPRRDRPEEYRVAAWLDDPAFPVDDEVRAVHAAAVDALRRTGLAVNDAARPDVDLRERVSTYLRLLIPVALAGMPRAQFDVLRDLAAASADDADDPMVTIARNVTIRHRDWLTANERRHQLRARIGRFFQEWDALLLPVTPVPAIPHDHSDPLGARSIRVNGAARPYTDLFSWIALATMAYLPATVAPLGRTAGGLPVGVQIVGPYLEDRTAIDLARHVERTLGGFVSPPGF